MNIMHLSPSPIFPLSFPNPLPLAGRPSLPPPLSCFLGRSPGNIMVPEVGTPVKKIRLDNIGYSGRKNVGVSCFASKGKGFGPEPARKEKSSNFKSPNERKQSKILSTQPPSSSATPGSRDSEGKSGNILSDRQFMDRLEAVRRSAIEQKKTEEEKATGTIDYDAPIEMEKNTIGLGTRIGVGIAVVVFGLVFALGDFLPSGLNPNEDGQVVEKKLKPEEKAALQVRLQQYQETLKDSPNDLSALEGAAVTSVDLGDYNQASDFLEKLTNERPKDPEAYRLLGEVKYLLKDYDKSAAAYKNSLSASEELNFESLRGLTNALLAAKKPEEAVQVLLSSAERLNDINPNNPGASVEQSEKMPVVDPIQVQLLLGKAYSDWGHVSDAVSVYDQLISKYPDDFRGYLAKGIILKENGKAGDAERMFIQARFFAPEKAKPLVDRYARR